MLDAIGFTRGVLVQPSAHGLDNRALLNALSVDPARVRGVAVVDQGASVESLAALKSRGVRGLRFSRLLDAHGASRYKNTVDVSAIDELLPKMLEVGLHAQLWLGVDELAELSPLIRSASIPFVIDHLGRCDARRGVGDTAFQLMCDLVREGHLWVKLTPYRASTEFPHYQDMRPFHEHLVATRPDRLLWGSDWPHVNIQRHVPDAGHLVDLLDSWTPDRSTWRQILVSNPSQLYDF
ncbi:amidohydrolase family protein [Variovorax defluvii]|uniref:Amidohydrolase family protein n=2 Tax=Variovorax defluvii TaxID=913761 RepID=A0ABP8HE69_9BURK